MRSCRRRRSFYVLRFLLGVAESRLFYPGIILYLTYWFPSARRAKMVALFVGAVPLAGMVGSPISGAILSSMDGVGGLAGWQWLFLLEAMPSVVMGLIALALLDDDPKRAKWLSDGERHAIEADLDAEQKAT
ncbi:MFS transporter, partial [Paraburkholderia dipogonis]|uniref:MFS transporter n=1 Tax=Paraburkholderia dipogonis TaxID=1211383 RepID=UPI0035E7C5F2